MKNTQDYLYLKEIGVDIRIKGVLSGLDVLLTETFEKEIDAERFLTKHNWKKDTKTKKWFKT